MLPGRMSLADGASLWGGVWGSTPTTAGMDAAGITVSTNTIESK